MITNVKKKTGRRRWKLRPENRFQVVRGVLLNMNFSFSFPRQGMWLYVVLFNCFVYNQKFIFAIMRWSLPGCYTFCLFVLIFRIRIFANITWNDLGNYNTFGVYSLIYFFVVCGKVEYYLQKNALRNWHLGSYSSPSLLAFINFQFI